MRAFIAIELPESIRKALASEQARFRGVCPDARWTRPEGIHLTLKFLGEISGQQEAEVKNALSRMERFEKFTVEGSGLRFFPGRETAARVLGRPGCSAFAGASGGTS